MGACYTLRIQCTALLLTRRVTCSRPRFPLHSVEYYVRECSAHMMSRAMHLLCTVHAHRPYSTSIKERADLALSLLLGNRVGNTYIPNWTIYSLYGVVIVPAGPSYHLQGLDVRGASPTRSFLISKESVTRLILHSRLPSMFLPFTSSNTFPSASFPVSGRQILLTGNY